MSFISSPSLAAINYYGAFSDYTTQTLAAGASAPMRLGQTDYAKGFSIVSDSRITAQRAGLYNLQFSAQFENTSIALDDVNIWLKVNNVDITGSTGFVSIPNKHGGINGHAIVGWNWYVNLAAGHYVEIYWTNNGTSNITTYPAGVTPVTPSTASVVVTLGLVA